MDRRHRLARTEDYQRVRRSGRSWSHALLVVVAKQNTLPYIRFGFLVSKRIGKAVQRNRVRRRLREVARSRLQWMGPGWDILIIARPPIIRASFQQIRDALDTLLHRAGLLPVPQDAD